MTALNKKKQQKRFNCDFSDSEHTMWNSHKPHKVQSTHTTDRDRSFRLHTLQQPGMKFKKVLPSSNHWASPVSSLSCQSSRLPCCCVCGVHSRAPLCQSAYSNRDSSLGRLTLENTTAPVTHVGLRGLTGLHLTPCVRAEQWLTDCDCVCAAQVRRFRLIHTPSWGRPRLEPPTLRYPCSRQSQLWGLHRQYRADCSDATLPVLMNRLDFLEQWLLIWQQQLVKLKLRWVSRSVSLPFQRQLLFSEWNHTAL